MMRRFYVAGRFRHYRPGGEMDLVKMRRELADELRWGQIIVDCGCLPILPLAQSWHQDVDLEIHSYDWINHDIALIEDLRSGYDGILMRPGWGEIGSGDDRPNWYPDWPLPPSVGAKLEFEAAQDTQLLIAFGEHGEDVVREYLTQLSNHV